MIRSLYCAPDGHCRPNLPVQEFAPVVQERTGLLWVDFQGESDETCEPILQQVFGFHPLAIDDALQESHVPKVDDWGDYLYLVLHAVLFDRNHTNDEHVHTLELDVFLGPSYVVTHHDDPIAGVDRVWTSCLRDERHMTKGASHLTYRLADELVADYMPVVEEIEDEIDLLEDQVFDQASPHTLEQIFDLKRALLRLRRIMIPQREVLNKLGRGDFEVLDAEQRAFFRDVYDHLVRLNDINESMRDLLSGAMDTYLSVVNNRMNDIMKTLTIMTTLFMPLSFIVGFFGMNFFQAVSDPMKVWTGEVALILTLLLIVLTPAAMYLWIRRRGWM